VKKFEGGDWVPAVQVVVWEMISVCVWRGFLDADFEVLI
jgi:hypothetical protein